MGLDDWNQIDLLQQIAFLETQVRGPDQANCAAPGGRQANGGSTSGARGLRSEGGVVFRDLSSVAFSTKAGKLSKRLDNSAQPRAKLVEAWGQNEMKIDGAAAGLGGTEECKPTIWL
jgi:hypothetical protein